MREAALKFQVQVQFQSFESQFEMFGKAGKFNLLDDNQ